MKLDLRSKSSGNSPLFWYYGRYSPPSNQLFSPFRPHPTDKGFFFKKIYSRFIPRKARGRPLKKSDDNEWYRTGSHHLRCLLVLPRLEARVWGQMVS